MEPIIPGRPGIFTTGTSISDSPTWFSSLLRQVRELRETWKNPRAPIATTAESDPAALEKLIETPAPLGALSFIFWPVLLVRHVHEILEDRHRPVIATTAAPAEVEEIWSRPNNGVPRLLSLAAHVGVIALIFIAPWAVSIATPPATETTVMLYTPPLPKVALPPIPKNAGGGGGGGKHQLTAASKGEAPKFAAEQIVPPSPEPIKNLAPEVTAPETLVALNAPHITMDLAMPAVIGDPLGKPNAPPSSGTGNGNGIGTGDGNGVGEGVGPGAGARGRGGNRGGNGGLQQGDPPKVAVAGVGGVTMPQILHKVDPLYSEDARKNKTQGTVTLKTTIKSDGTVDRNILVVRKLGMGLDEKAIEAVRQWSFKPATRNGQPVDAEVTVEVTFRLL